MVVGLERFSRHFAQFQECYVLIGGAACDLWMGERELPFRATKDLDVVLIVDSLTPEFVKMFWQFIREARFATHQQSTERPKFYRFEKPANRQEYPFRIELLSKNVLELPDDIHLTPIPVGDELSSLSAILLDSGYYDYIFARRTTIHGTPTIPADCIIQHKAKAHLDLRARREDGDANVKEEDVNKHKYDVFRIYLSLAPEDRFELPALLRKDLAEFIALYPPSAPDWSDIRRAVRGGPLPEPETVITQLRAIFSL